MKKRNDYLAVITIILLSIISIAGVLSMKFSYSYDYVNQYGQKIQLFGYGIYARDTYFKAPISIGTDFCILFILVPVFLYTYNKYRNQKNNITELQLISVYAVSVYYGASIAFGVVYNQLFLLYILLFSCSLFCDILSDEEKESIIYSFVCYSIKVMHYCGCYDDSTDYLSGSIWY